MISTYTGTLFSPSVIVISSFKHLSHDLQVDFLAVDEAEYTVNYRILQRVASKGKVGGLNKDAKVFPTTFCKNLAFFSLKSL